MSKIRQIDYKTPRLIRSLKGDRVVRLTGRDNRYQFEGVLVEGKEDEEIRIGDHRTDWQKSAFPVPWTDDPERIE